MRSPLRLHPMPVQHTMLHPRLRQHPNRLARLERIMKHISQHLTRRDRIVPVLILRGRLDLLHAKRRMRLQPPTPHHSPQRLLRHLGQPLALLIKIQQLPIALLFVERRQLLHLPIKTHQREPTTPTSPRQTTADHDSNPRTLSILVSYNFRSQTVVTDADFTSGGPMHLLLEAVPEMGLRLVKTKGPVEKFIIDTVEPPTPD